MTFRARFDGRCGDCGELIWKGDELVMVDGFAVHVECADDSEPGPRPVCPRCCESIAVNGTCGCDE